MVKHVVVFKLKDLNDGPKLKDAIESMAGKIPGLLAIEAGLDFNKSDAAGDLILISSHTDKDALNVYQDHPVHVDVKNQIVPCVTSRTVVDYEV